MKTAEKRLSRLEIQLNFGDRFDLNWLQLLTAQPLNQTNRSIQGWISRMIHSPK